MSWYCLHLKGNQEFKAENNLLSQGFDVYLPRTQIEKKRQGNANKKLQVQPLFPNYLFINLIEGKDDFSTVKNTRGVHDFAMRSLVKVHDYIIDELKERENEQGLHYIPENDYQVGEAVRIKKGAFKMYEAIIAEKRNRRIWIVLNEMEGNRKIEMKLNEIEPVV